jgi:hypothetical protein
MYIHLYNAGEQFLIHIFTTVAKLEHLNKYQSSVLY